MNHTTKQANSEHERCQADFEAFKASGGKINDLDNQPSKTKCNFNKKSEK